MKTQHAGACDNIAAGGAGSDGGGGCGGGCGRC